MILPCTVIITFSCLDVAWLLYMFNSRSYTSLAFLLSWIGGFTDAVAYPVLYQVFIANMSGNGVAFGIHGGKGQWGEN